MNKYVRRKSSVKAVSIYGYVLVPNVPLKMYRPVEDAKLIVDTANAVKMALEVAYQIQEAMNLNKGYYLMNPDESDGWE